LFPFAPKPPETPAAAPVLNGILTAVLVGFPVKMLVEPPAAEMMDEAIDPAALTGHTVVVSIITSVITPPPAADRAGQSVMVGAQLVMV
jgi:hypothetical protein